ncbi:MAG: NERD domain-containing protein [Anaerolineales bacterium]|nr:NERD domain-containing protein [Anaerolineales bacterium]
MRFNSKMTIDEARSTIWPFREIKGQPFGPLLDKGLLSPQDLGYAVQKAYDPRVREAARVILIHLQEQVEPNGGPLNMVASEFRSFSERRQIQLAFIQGTIISLSLAPLMFGLGWSLRRATSESDKQSLSEIVSKPAGIIALAIVLVLMVAIPWGYTKIIDMILTRFDKKIRLHRKGQLGEERVINVMYSVLNNQWWVFRNVELPKRRSGDLDLVLVGPQGVWCFEVKAYSGDYRNIGDSWEKRFGSRWLPLTKNPSQQARRNATRLSQLLGSHQIKQWVDPIVIWANPESSVIQDTPSTLVWTLDELHGHLSTLTTNKLIEQGKLQEIIKILSDIVQSED